MKRRIAILLCAVSLCGGCRSWNVSVFDQPVQATELSGEEKAGTILIIAIAIAAIVAGAVVASS